MPAPGRGGFWLGLGLGAGGESFDLQPSAGYSDVLYKPTVSFRLGGTLGQHVRLGAEVLSWINDVGPAVESLSSALIIAQVYPWSGAGLYLKGGVGLGRNGVSFDDGYDEWDTGFAGLIGAGYELRLGRRFFLNPSIDLVGHQYDNSFIGGLPGTAGQLWFRHNVTNREVRSGLKPLPIVASGRYSR